MQPRLKSRGNADNESSVVSKNYRQTRCRLLRFCTVKMANPLAALGRALAGGGDGGGQSKDLWEAIRHDDAGAVAQFLRGSDVNKRGPVRAAFTSSTTPASLRPASNAKIDL